MKHYNVTVFLGILLLAACTPTPTSTPIAVLPTSIPSATKTSTPLPEGKTIIVTSTSDSGPGSLRQALLDAEPYDTITFDPAIFPPDAPVTIYVSSEELPYIHVSHLTLDASNAGVILDGSLVLGDWVAGLQIVSAKGVTIMGLQISHFYGPGIALSGMSKHNIIGGDLGVGSGPFGQGNLFSNNNIGIDLATSHTSHNTIIGNLIGTDTEDTNTLGNYRSGVFINEGAHNNTVGPDNIIAFNGESGVAIFGLETRYNTITQNSIYEHSVKDIWLEFGSNDQVTTSFIYEFDISAGTATGAACPSCTIDIFSTRDNGGGIFEDQTIADELGVFTFNMSQSFSGPNLTVTTTDLDGNTSIFSRPTAGMSGNLILQLDNNLPRTQFKTLNSGDLSDNRISAQFDNFQYPETFDIMLYPEGVTRARVGIDGLEPERVDWDQPEFSVDPMHDEVFTRMANNGLAITNVLTFWDKETYPGGEGAPCARFKTEGEIERYLEFVRFTVDHFKDRVQYYEIWNEPELRWFCPKWIELVDYINLVKRTVPVIREEYPEAKIVVGSVANTVFPETYNYLFGLLESDIMPLVDVISFHPMYGTSPEFDLYVDYYYNYPEMIQRIKDTAAAHGFVGEYQADELTWRTQENTDPGQPWVYTPITANKYFGRGALMNLGLDVGIGIGADFFLLPNLSTVMAGAEPVELSIEIQSTADNIVSYTFSVPDGGYLVALWTDDIAVENDPGVETIVTIPDLSASEVIGIDLLYGIKQELITTTENGDLLISNLLIKDYPIIIKLIDITP